MDEKRNFTLLTDFYELTMMQGYFREKADDIVVFDAFYRKNPSRKRLCDRLWSGTGDRLYQESVLFL